MKAKQLFEIELRNDNMEGLLDIIDNGHPSIDNSHPCYSALEDLSTKNGCHFLTWYNNFYQK